MKEIVNDIYTNYINSKYEYYKTQDDHIAQKFMEEVTKEENRITSLRGRNLSALRRLNKVATESLTQGQLCLTNPKTLEAYGYIFAFVIRISAKFDKQILSLGFISPGINKEE